MQNKSLTMAKGGDRHVGLVNSPALGETVGNDNLQPEQFNYKSVY